MSRREAVRRIVLGVIYLPLYALVLYPAALVIGLVLGMIDVVHILVTKEKPDYVARFGKELWSWTGQNMGYILSGEGDFEYLPRPIAERELRA